MGTGRRGGKGKEAGERAGMEERRDCRYTKGWKSGARSEGLV